MPEESPLVVVVVHTGPKAAAVVVVVQKAQGSSGCCGPQQGQVSRVVVVLTRLRAAAFEVVLTGVRAAGGTPYRTM